MRNNSTNVTKLIKIPTGKKPTLPVISVNVRVDKPSRQPAPIRAALASARKFMQAIGAISLPVKKDIHFVWPRALYRIVKGTQVILR